MQSAAGDKARSASADTITGLFPTSSASPGCELLEVAALAHDLLRWRFAVNRAWSTPGANRSMGLLTRRFFDDAITAFSVTSYKMRHQYRAKCSCGWEAGAARRLRHGRNYRAHWLRRAEARLDYESDSSSWADDQDDAEWGPSYLAPRMRTQGEIWASGQGCMRLPEHPKLLTKFCFLRFLCEMSELLDSTLVERGRRRATASTAGSARGGGFFADGRTQAGCFGLFTERGRVLGCVARRPLAI